MQMHSFAWDGGIWGAYWISVNLLSGKWLTTTRRNFYLPVLVRIYCVLSQRRGFLSWRAEHVSLRHYWLYMWVRHVDPLPARDLHDYNRALWWRVHKTQHQHYRAVAMGSEVVQLQRWRKRFGRQKKFHFSVIRMCVRGTFVGWWGSSGSHRSLALSTVATWLPTSLPGALPNLWILAEMWLLPWKVVWLKLDQPYWWLWPCINNPWHRNIKRNRMKQLCIWCKKLRKKEKCLWTRPSSVPSNP